MFQFKTHEYYMKMALQQAQYAFDEDEVPVGAIIVSQQQIIAKAYNQTERLQDVTAHAEMLAITAAANYMGGKYLKNCTLYVTLEPCVMCGAATYWSQLGGIVFGAGDEKRGCIRLQKQILHPKTHIVSGILSNECLVLLQDFFRKKRK